MRALRIIRDFFSFRMKTGPFIHAIRVIRDFYSQGKDTYATG